MAHRAPMDPNEFDGASRNARTPRRPVDVSAMVPRAPRPCPPYSLQNVVATFNLGCSYLNLRQIALKHPFFEYNPKRFAAATLRIKHPRTTALVFASGNMVCTGARNEVASRYAARKYARMMQRCGICVMFRRFKIQNIVASMAIGSAMKLDEIAMAFGPYASYEPELFPGLVFRTVNPKVVFLVFRSGKVVITGAKSREHIEHTLCRFYHEILLEYTDTVNHDTSSSRYRSDQKKRCFVPSFFDKDVHEA